jgi:GNAT superfamily N-acetyltransferase
MALRITIPDTPSEADREAVIAPLREYNVSQAGDPDIKSVAILLTDDDGRSVGGLWGRIAYTWLFVELLAVPEKWRGQSYGTALMQEAERIAHAEHCMGIWLDTFDFQARGFYEKLGFEIFGTLDDIPLGHCRYFMRKRL